MIAVTVATAGLVIAVLVTVPLHVPSNLAAELLVVELVVAGFVHTFCEHPALVFTTWRLWVGATLVDAPLDRASRDSCATVLVATRFDAEVEQLATYVFAAILAGGPVRLLAVVLDALHQRGSRELDALFLAITRLEAEQTLLEHGARSDLAVLFTDRRLRVLAVVVYAFFVRATRKLGTALVDAAPGAAFATRASHASGTALGRRPKAANAADPTIAAATAGPGRYATVVHFFGVRFASVLTSRRLGVVAVLHPALRQDLAPFGGARVFVPIVVLARQVVLRGLRLATLFTGRRRTLAGTVEERAHGAREARLTVIAAVGALIEGGKRCG